VEALAADGYFRPTSLDAPVADDTPIAEMLGAEDVAMRAVEAKLVLEPLIAELAERERRIVDLRFYQERTQQQIADEVGITQAQVSRILMRTLSRLRTSLADHTPAA
jgi:RNA polymerase sigma-B factor